MRKPKLFPWSLILPLVLTATLYSVLDGNEANSQEKTPARGTASVDAPAPESSFAPSAAGTSSEAPKPEAHRRSKEEGCLTDPLAIEDLHKKSDELDARSKEFVAKDAELKAREKALEEELARLHSIRDEIAKIDDARKKENDERVSKIVTTVETMSPKAASQLLGTLEDSLAVATMGRMD
ncbi:MAG: MotE family protein, partial [Bdellovibrionota bacterium]